ncbi:MAG: hypothetical protein H0X53_08420 [Sphingomonas sp.]|nr:hypothetical protein [Sphingomonas sp.]
MTSVEMADGNATNASATVASSRPSDANRALVSSQAVEIESRLIYPPSVVVARVYAGLGGGLQSLVGCSRGDAVASGGS